MSKLKGPLIKRLKTFTAVAASAGGRVYSNQIPQGTALPAVTVSLDTKDRNQHLTGYDDSLVMDEFYIRVYATDTATAESIGDSIAANLDSIEDETITDANDANGRVIQSVIIRDENDIVDSTYELSDEYVYIYEIETQIQHSGS